MGTRLLIEWNETMSEITDPSMGCWTAADLVRHFGPIPLSRVRQNPPPGTATVSDVIRIHDTEDRLFELADGTLVEKTVGIYESFLAAVLVRLIGNFVAEQDSGIVLGADGIMELTPGLVRIPDVSFISWDRLPGRSVPRDPIAEIVPDLAVEVISPSNTRQEMDRKLVEYFQAGVRLVWYVYPKTCETHVYVRPDKFDVVTLSGRLVGGDVLPGFELPLESVFEKGQD